MSSSGCSTDRSLAQEPRGPESGAGELGSGARTAPGADVLARVLEEDGDRLFALAMRVTRNPDLASDAVQEAFATALERFDGFRGDSKPGTWMYRIVYNKAIDLLRRRGREEPLPEEEPLASSADVRLGHAPGWSRPPDELLFSSETREALEKALDHLTPAQRAVFSLREIEGRSAEEVGRILEMPPGTVRVYLHRARLRLRALLSPHFAGSRP